MKHLVYVNVMNIFEMYRENVRQYLVVVMEHPFVGINSNAMMIIIAHQIVDFMEKNLKIVKKDVKKPMINRIVFHIFIVINPMIIVSVNKYVC
ncbi:hypothetical protein BLA29_013203 [Euroglyphus maynei]|uniref:Uncharacterized protein n=1 Tax=Euroglyphus maynei TaxID=6958 RepID=A0A1Y3B1B8_EURMA|nr:hypothetical protein BLA29_013203 [Euroglyphus maynei]